MSVSRAQSMDSHLSRAIDDMVVPKEMSSLLEHGEINDAYLENVLDLNKKLTNVAAMKAMDVMAVKQVESGLQHLKAKVCCREIGCDGSDLCVEAKLFAFSAPCHSSFCVFVLTPHL